MSLWSKARGIAEKTPETRNRHVDFLRAASIGVVVVGHWMVAAPYLDPEGQLRLGRMLELSPWTQWLTWALQVMPVFFLVGGFSNEVTWSAARRDGLGYASWVGARLRRLVTPLAPLLLAWLAMAAVAHRFGVHPEMIRVGSQAAFIPTWFLAVYTMVVVAVPLTHWLYRRFDVRSFWGLAALAFVIDTLAFRAGLTWLRWVNYGCIWLAMHQLGYLWRHGRVGGASRAWLWAAGGLSTLVLLVTVLGYPTSMITVGNEEVSNSQPPTFALLALGVFQAGLVFALEPSGRRWLRRIRPWTTTVLVNGVIMTVYLWHLTAMVLVIGLVHLLGDPGLGLEPGSLAWWAWRPFWVAVYGAALAVLVALFLRFEQTSRKGAAANVPAWRAVTGALVVCGGLAVLALQGIGGPGWLGIRVVPAGLALAGIALIVGTPRAAE